MSDTTELPIRVYTPDPLLAHPMKQLRDMLWDVWAGRELAWRLMVRDISAQYRQTLLGYVWVFLPPLVSSLTFVFLNSQGVLQIGKTSLPYPAFAMLGTLLWQVFVDALQAPITSLQHGKQMLVKINFPREAILLSALGIVVFNFMIRLSLLIVVLIWFNVPFTSSLLFVPLSVSALIVCGFAFGIILAPVGGLYGDISRVIPVISGFWMLLTPVVYPPMTKGLAGILATWNPVSPLIVTTREALTGQPLTFFPQFWIVFAGSLLLLVLGWIGFRIAMPHLIARIGA
jgi:lipopolysaccharide transport system permease protein